MQTMKECFRRWPCKSCSFKCSLLNLRKLFGAESSTTILPVNLKRFFEMVHNCSENYRSAATSNSLKLVDANKTLVLMCVFCCRDHSQRSFDVLISREGKKEQRRSEPRRDWGEKMVKRTPASRRRSHGRNFCT